jgi:hypothetical protein
VVIRCHADEMSLTQADLEASLNWKWCPSTHGQVDRCLLSNSLSFSLWCHSFPEQFSFKGFYWVLSKTPA